MEVPKRMERMITLSEVRILVEQARLSEEDVGEIMVKCESTSRFNLILEAFAGYAKENPEVINGFILLQEYQSKSPYLVEDWFEALDYFYEWLSLNERYYSLPSILAYIEGVIENDENKGSMSLREQVAEMLDNYCLEV
ncbi:MAG: hypothetical protein COZ46_08225 [Verrucomicrobia bacterium CG_4_10_14_3_um_filter_43_23]|nr:MAG: hypothetical protein AUJ82_02470 [Verrucomicrobia bacterium CG1_02_43_26]PIP59129.1 MAG: hypothetical protein COX01_04870 [Verrucomicrobia bacterium CG22_combo_CG10-13_8_21_14_all_43_17]PIX57596.1 MAG: hypothetical protein COZ46_08225 [Verrucomicrobia bacterium CG_4_10_14_3_um_filter_43_23]PIY62712.1 MAG: hypothetical protein COY94_01245 [Verrucomicrobia bacterium CG_4_10_14_0_8_um_filter_43_34]PJA43736.1 MAG: hypothetical protein CO175_06360 [Verrucomicrobia bacterium CG_4_9_14_3_um_fi